MPTTGTVVTRGIGSKKILGRGLTPFAGSSGPATGNILTRGMGSKKTAGRGFSATTPGVTYPDLVAAVIGQLRTYDGGSFATALGDSTSTPKIWVGAVMGSPALPWVRIMRPIGTREYMANGNFIETGQIQVSVFASSYSAARNLAWQISSPNLGSINTGALDDPPIKFTEGSLMVLRLSQPAWITDDGVGVGVPKTYHAVLTFDYKFSGQIA